MISADQYTTEKTVNKTEAAQIFLANPGIALTVNFNTKVDEKAVKTSLYDLYPNKGGKFASEADFKKKICGMNDIEFVYLGEGQKIYL